VKYSDSANLKVLPEPAKAVIEKEIVAGRVWRVKFQGHYWFARLYQAENMISDDVISFHPGELVHIVAMQGITVLIRPLSEVTKSEIIKQDQLQSQQIENFPQRTKEQEDDLRRKQKEEDDSRRRQLRENKTLSFSKTLAEKGDRIIAFASGGAFAGGLIAQVPGAVIGAAAGAIFGWFESNKTAKASEEP
jgi:hypothetical protein